MSKVAQIFSKSFLKSSTHVIPLISNGDTLAMDAERPTSETASIVELLLNQRKKKADGKEKFKYVRKVGMERN